MKNRNKRFTSVLAASMALGMMAPAMVSVAPVMAAGATTEAAGAWGEAVNGIYYSEPVPASGEYENGRPVYTTTVVGSVDNYAFGDITIGNSSVLLTSPENENKTVYAKVIAIADNAFTGNENIESVTLGSNLRDSSNGDVTTPAVGEAAFAGCSSLTSVTVNADTDNPITIGKNAFNGINGSDKNNALTSVTLNSGVAAIGQNAFQNNAYLTSVTFNNDGTLKTIGQGSFLADVSLENITIPNSVTTIASSAFNGTSLTGSITLPEKLTSIGKNSFKTDAGSLTLVLPQNSKGALIYDSIANFPWGDSVFGIVLNSNGDVSASDKRNYKIVGNGSAASCLKNAPIDSQLYVMTPTIITNIQNSDGSFVSTTEKGEDGTEVTTTTNFTGNIEIVLGQSVVVKVNAGTLYVDGKEVADYKGNNNTYTFVTPQIGKHSITYTTGGLTKEVVVNVIPAEANYWTNQNITVPEVHAGEEVKPEGATSMYGTPYYVYSTTKGGNYTTTAPTKAGTYWVKAKVDPVAGVYDGIETDPVKFTILPALPKTGWEELSDGTWTYYEEGEVVGEGLKTIGDDTYLFNDKGIMLTGWQKVDGSYMFFDNAGHSKKGWLNDNGTWYYLDADGIMVANEWVKDGGKDYFLTDNGAMAVSRWLTKDGHDVYVDNSGALKTGWLAWNLNWYYLEPSTGYMATSGTVDGWNIQSNGIAVKA